MRIEDMINALISEGEISQADIDRAMHEQRERIENKEFDYSNLNLEETQELKKEEMKYRCEKAIVKGFEATNGYWYRTNRDDQINMIGQKDDLFEDTTITEVQWKTEDVGYITHTRDEWLTVYKEAFTHKQNQLFKYNQLKGQIFSLTDIDEIKAITW